jgi:hypothetical protein
MLFTEASTASDGSPRKGGFFRCLANLRSTLGVKPDEDIPSEIFAELKRTASAFESAIEAQQTVAPAPSGSVDSERLTADQAVIRMPRIYRRVARQNSGKSQIQIRVACISELKRLMQFSPDASLPNVVLNKLLSIETSRLAGLSQSENQKAPEPPRIKKHKKGPSRKSARLPKKQQSPPKNRQPFRWHQELPERSAWSGAPWDKSFAEYRWS